MSSQQYPWVGIPIGSGRYFVKKHLARGGYGDVFMAHDKNINCDVVLKAPRLSWLEEADFKERYEREIRSMVALSHPNTAKVLDLGEHEGRPFTVIEYYCEGTLADRIHQLHSKKESPPVNSLNIWLPGIAAALDFVHDQGYVHRDVKPDNILFDRHNTPKLADFGIIKVILESDPSKTLTARGIALGTPEFMSSELCTGNTIDGKVDQYALAVTVFKYLTGQYPLEGSNQLATIKKQTTIAPPVLHELDSSIPYSVSNAVDRALSKDPKQRFNSCKEFAEAVLANPGVQDAPDSPETVGQSTTPPVAPPGNAVQLRDNALDKQSAKKQPFIRPEPVDTKKANDAGSVSPKKNSLPDAFDSPSANEQHNTSSSAPDPDAVLDHTPSVDIPSKRVLIGGITAAVLLIFFIVILPALMGPDTKTTYEGDSVAKVPAAEEVAVGETEPAEELPEEELAKAILPSQKPIKPTDVDKTKLEKVSEAEISVYIQQNNKEISRLLKLLQSNCGERINKKVLVTNSVGMKLVLIPPGSFMMGSHASEEGRDDDELQHKVRLTKPFYMGKYEVTQNQYQQVMGKNPSTFSSSGINKADVTGMNTDMFPVENVNWLDCVVFCNELSEIEGLPAYYQFTNVQRAPSFSDGPEGSIIEADVIILGGKGYRLPTEAEWEYACRAGTIEPFHYGSVSDGSKSNVNGEFPYGTTNQGPNLNRTTTVGSYDANNFGLHDMHGNVWEWCNDWYDENYYEQFANKLAIDPQCLQGNFKYHVARGGSWQGSTAIRNNSESGSDDGLDSRSASRTGSLDSFFFIYENNSMSGFRLCRNP